MDFVLLRKALNVAKKEKATTQKENNLTGLQDKGRMNKDIKISMKILSILSKNNALKGKGRELVS